MEKIYITVRKIEYEHFKEKNVKNEAKNSIRVYLTEEKDALVGKNVISYLKKEEGVSIRKKLTKKAVIFLAFKLLQIARENFSYYIGIIEKK